MAIACVFSISILIGTADASSWGPTLLVNTEAFQSIDDTDSSADIVLKFGDSLAKTLTYERSAGQFKFDDDLEVIGTVSGSSLHAQDGLTSSGTLTIEGTTRFESPTDSTTFLQVNDADGGNPVVNIDTTNERLGIGLNNPSVAAHIRIGGSSVGTFASNVGIGIQSTAGGTSEAYLGIMGGSSGVSGIHFGYSNNPDEGRILYRESGKKLEFFVNDVSQFSIDTGGTASGKHIHAENGLTSSGTLVFEGAASGSSLYLGSSLNGAGLSDCDDSTGSKLLWDTTTGRFSCGTDQSGGGGSTGTGSLQVFFDERYVRTAGDTMTGALLIHSMNDTSVTADTEILFEVSGTASGTVLHAQRQLTSSGSTTIEINDTAEGALLIEQNTDEKGITIDTEATTQNALEISASTLTTGKGINIGDGDAFTTGTGLLATFISNSSDAEQRSLFHLSNEHTSAINALVMNLKQNADTTNLYLDQNGNGIAIDVDSQATTQPGVRISMPTQDASANPHLLFGYENLFDTNLFRNAYNALTTSGSLSIDPSGFNGVYRYDGSSYNSNLTEARTTGGTPFTVLANENPSDDYLYVGANAPFGIIHVDIVTAAVGITSLGADYYDGSTWTDLGMTDNTTRLTVDGTLEINPPNNWSAISINADLTSYYWLRIHANATNITTAPTAYSVSPTQGYRMRVWSQADDAQPALFVSHDQKVGIGTNTPAYSLEVAGDINTTAGGYRDAGSCVAGTCASDERLKHDIRPIENALDTIGKLTPSSYEFNDPHYGDGKQFGLIAQQVENILPDLVEENQNGYKTVKYGMQLQMLTMAAVKELDKKIEEMEQLHFGKQLEEQLSEFAKQMESISARLTALEEKAVDTGNNGTILSIQAGAVTVSGAYHLIAGDTKKEAVLAVMNGGNVGQILVLQAAPDAKVTVRKTQKIMLTKDDCKLENEDVLVLMKIGEEQWIEISRSANSGNSLQNIFNGWSGTFNVTD